MRQQALSFRGVGPFFDPFFFNLRIINPQPMWNPQIAALCVASLAVGAGRNNGFRTAVTAMSAVQVETAEDGPIVPRMEF